MTTAPAVYGQFGQALGLAERTLSANLRAHLADRDVEPETWYALQLVATRGVDRLARSELTDTLESPYFGAASVYQLLARLETDGLIRGEAEVELTDEGKALHGSLREYIASPTVELLNQFDTGDIETTVRTLKAITERAAKR
jgi:hypothetical protein